MIEEKCKFYKKQFLSKYCELFNQPCYGKHCNFIKEFTRLNELEQQLQIAKEENEKLRNLLGKPYKRRIDLENNKLTQQNKQLETKILRMQTALDKIRDIELASIDVDWDEYKAECGTTDFSAIVTNCEIGLGETEE